MVENASDSNAELFQPRRGVDALVEGVAQFEQLELGLLVVAGRFGAFANPVVNCLLCHAREATPARRLRANERQFRADSSGSERTGEALPRNAETSLLGGFPA